MIRKMKMQERRAKELELEMVWESSQDIGDGADLFTGWVVKIFISHNDGEEYDDDDRAIAHLGTK